MENDSLKYYSNRWNEGVNPADKIRLNRINVFLNNCELQKLNDCRGSASKSEAMRIATFSNLPRPIPAINQTGWLDLAKATGNLNQLIHHLNHLKKGFSELDFNQNGGVVINLKGGDVFYAWLAEYINEIEKAVGEVKALRSKLVNVKFEDLNYVA
jgi:hypothetical protein